MTDRISAEEGALARGTAALDAAGTSIAGSTARVQSSFGELAGVWKGEAAVSYGALMEQWDEDVRHLQAVLAGLRGALAATERDQLAVDEHQTSVIKGLGSMMGGGA
jgi:WXG100 family type VII secretion target